MSLCIQSVAEADLKTIFAVSNRQLYIIILHSGELGENTMSRRNDYDYFDLDNFDDSIDSREYRRRPQGRLLSAPQEDLSEEKIREEQETELSLLQAQL